MVAIVAPADDGTDRAQRVLQRFVRDFVVSYTARRSHQKLVLLESAFRKAEAHRRYSTQHLMSPPKSAVNPERLLEKRLGLERKYSASCVRPPSPLHNGQEDGNIVPKSTSECAELAPPDVASQDSEESDVGEHRHVTFELVVQHLHARLEQARGDLIVRDRRIQELEALVSSLTTENTRLCVELLAARELPRGSPESNQHT